jgi:hypothetical protein
MPKFGKSSLCREDLHSHLNLYNPMNISQAAKHFLPPFMLQKCKFTYTPKMTILKYCEAQFIHFSFILISKKLQINIIFQKKHKYCEPNTVKSCFIF